MPGDLLVHMTIEEHREMLAEVVDRALYEREKMQAKHCPRVEEQLTIAEAKAKLRCSERTLRKMLAAGLIKRTKLRVGGSSRILISTSEIARVLAEGAI